MTASNTSAVDALLTELAGYKRLRWDSVDDGHVAVSALNRLAERARQIASLSQQGDSHASDCGEDVSLCIACGLALKPGDLYYPDHNGGEIHAACCGPEPEAFRGDDGEPLKPGDPTPAPSIWHTVERSAPLPAPVAWTDDDLEHAFDALWDLWLAREGQGDRAGLKRDAMHAALASLNATPPAKGNGAGSGWLDIATAPKDWTTIDLWVLGRRVADCRWGKPTGANWGDRYGFDRDLPEGWMTRSGQALDRRLGEPTHWMPPPAAPDATPALTEEAGERGLADTLADALRAFRCTQRPEDYPEEHWSNRAIALLSPAAGEQQS
jgi:hypothetical protein